MDSQPNISPLSISDYQLVKYSGARPKVCDITCYKKETVINDDNNIKTDNISNQQHTDIIIHPEINNHESLSPCLGFTDIEMNTQPTVNVFDTRIKMYHDMLREDAVDIYDIVPVVDSKSLETVNIEIELVAAYGPNAPNHVVIYTSNDVAGTVIVKAGAPQKISVTIKKSGTIRLSNGTPCRVPSSFDPSNASLSKICFGVSAVRITQVVQEG
jgi:hypothetical protein